MYIYVINGLMRSFAISGASDVAGTRASIQSSTPLPTKRSRPNWPPSVRREEAKVLMNLRKRLGFHRVRNTSIFKTIPSYEEQGVDESCFEESENQNSSSVDNNDSNLLENRTFLFKVSR